jgi:hypothetical protein
MGLNGFYGWVRDDYNYYHALPIDVFDEHSALDGNRWGIGASLGGTIKFKPLTLEPFIAGGYQSLNLSGNQILNSALLNKRDDTRNEWNIGGGLSVLYDL